MSWWAYGLLLVAAGSTAWAVYLAIRLRRARRTAETSVRINERLFASLGHEVRTPMTGIIGMTSLLQHTDLTGRQRQYLRTLQLSSESLLEIVEDVITFGKLESRRLELERTPFDLRACVEGALDKIAPAAARKGVELAYWIEEGTRESLIGDGERVGQVLRTLVSNGVKLSESGAVSLEVGGGSEGVISFSVRDAGPGWCEEDVEKLLYPDRTDAELARRYGGTGLGLAVCNRLVELMEGRLWLAETAGSGSVFRFTIRAEPAPGADRSQLYRPHPALRDRRVLVVVGAGAVRDAVHRQLEKLGMRPLSATSSAAALEQLGAAAGKPDGPFELAIVDQRTTADDGLGWAERLDQECRRRRLPVLRLATAGEEPPAAVGRSSEPAIYKPLKAAELLESLLELVGRAGDAH